MSIERLNPEGLSAPTGFSHVTVTGPGRLVHVSGQIARDRAGAVVGVDDLARQTEQVYANLRMALEAAGARFTDLIKVVTYVVGLTPENATTIRAVRERHMGAGPYPASTMVGVEALVMPELLIEIEVTAVID